MSALSDYILGLVPLSYWRLGETSGTTATDQKGAYNGTYTNGPLLNQTRLALSDPTAPSVFFDGTADHIVLTPGSNNLTSAVSISMLVDLDSTKASGTGSLMELGGLFGGKRIDVDFGAKKIYVYSAYEANLAGYTYTPDTTLHVVAVWDLPNNLRKLYINGVLQVSGAAATTAQNYGNFGIGGHTQNSLFAKANIQDVALFNRALTPSEITGIYNAASTIVVPLELTPFQGAIVLTGQLPGLFLGYQAQQKNIVLAGQLPEVYLGFRPTQKNIVLTGQTPDLNIGYRPLQKSIVLTGQAPVFDNTPVDLAYIMGRGFQSLPVILANSETTAVTGDTFGTVAKVFGGSLVAGSPFKTAPTLTVLADQTGYVTGRGFSTTPAIEVSHDFVATAHGRGFSSKATVVGGSIVVGGAFSTSLAATIDAPISLYVMGQGFQTHPNIVAEYQSAMRITGRGFVSGIGYSDVAGRGFTQNPILKALETANFAEAFVFNLVPANQEENLYSVSRYQNYPFQHLTRIANEYYGVKADGLYRLTGEYDTAEDILVNGAIKLNEDDLSAFNSQNIPYVYLNGDDDYTATAFVDDVEQPAFSSGFNGRRVKLARGSKGRYWYFKIEGIKSLLGVEYRPEKLARKVK